MTSAVTNLPELTYENAAEARRRRNVFALAMLYLLAVAWFSFTPFDFVGSPVDPAGTLWMGLPLATVHLPDVLANIALFVPMGLLLRVGLLRRGWSEAGSLLAAVVCAGAVGYGIEWVQQFSPSRVSSVADLACNLCGALVGAASVSVIRAFGAMWVAVHARVLRDWEEDVRKRPSGAAARLIAVGLFVAAMAPFDLTFSVHRVVESVRSVNLTPFATDIHVSAPVTSGDASFAVHQQARDQVQLVLDYVWIVCGYALLAVFVRRYLAAHCRMTAALAFLWTMAACLMLSLACFAAQLLIMSRVSDMTDMVFAALGATVGVVASRRLVEAWTNDADSEEDPRPRIVLAGLIVCGAFICVRQLAPFAMDYSNASVAAGWASIEWMPMATYQRAQLPVAIDDMLGKVGVFAAFGALAAWLKWLRGVEFDRKGALRLTLAVVAGTAVLECLQILLPSRMPSVTDLVIAVASVPLGIGVFQWATSMYEGIVAHGQTAFDRVVYNVEFESVESAPMERVPQPKRTTSDVED